MLNFSIAEHRVSLLVIIILILILVAALQAWYVVRLRIQIKHQPGNEKLVKNRLKKILKPSEID